MSKPSPKDRLIEICRGLTAVEPPVCFPEEHKDSVFLFRGEHYMFEYETKTQVLWCNSRQLWSILQREYMLSGDQIAELISGTAESLYKIKVIPRESLYGHLQFLRTRK